MKCPNCHRELKQIKGKVKLAVQLGEKEVNETMTTLKKVKELEKQINSLNQEINLRKNERYMATQSISLSKKQANKIKEFSIHRIKKIEQKKKRLKQKAKEILDNLGDIGCGEEFRDELNNTILTCPWDWDKGDIKTGEIEPETDICPECQIKQEIKQICERILR